MSRKADPSRSRDPFYWSKRESYRKRAVLSRDHARHTLLGSGDQHWNGLCKRTYPGHCEICGTDAASRLHYHHWDDNNPSMGLWLCPLCHRRAEGMDWALAYPERLEEYKLLKGQAQAERTQHRLL